LNNTPKNILLTGKPGCGKTAVIKEVLKKLKDLKVGPEEKFFRVGGFFTEEI